MALLHTAGGHACPICGGDCKGFPDTPHLASYPFLRGGVDPLADQEFVIATERIVEPGVRVVYGPGDRVPMADAVKYGLVDPPAKPKGKRARKPTEDRARKPTEDR